MSIDASREAYQRAQRYKKALSYLDSCGQLDYAKLNEMNRLAGYPLTEEEIQQLITQAEFMLPIDGQVSGMEVLKEIQRKSLKEGISTFESLSNQLGQPLETSTSSRPPFPGEIETKAGGRMDMKCPHCGKEIPRFPCPKCGEMAFENASYCVACGVPLKKNHQDALESDAFLEYDDGFDLEDRILCPDGTCTGIIVDGKCSDCGKAFTNNKAMASQAIHTGKLDFSIGKDNMEKETETIHTEPNCYGKFYRYRDTIDCSKCSFKQLCIAQEEIDSGEEEDKLTIDKAKTRSVKTNCPYYREGRCFIEGKDTGPCALYTWTPEKSPSAYLSECYAYRLHKGKIGIMDLYK